MSRGEGRPVGRGVPSSRVSGAILDPWMWISIIIGLEKGVLHNDTIEDAMALWCIPERKF